MSSGPTVIVLGILGQTPFAGVTWQVLQYLEGLRRVGCEVYYYEATGVWPGHPDQPTPEAGIANTVRYMARALDGFGFAGRWAYAAPTGRDELYGMPALRLRELIASADALLNLTASTDLRIHESLMRIPVRIYLETDPVTPQIGLAQGDRGTIEQLRLHTHLFSYGENFGAPDCGVPLSGQNYRPTRPPVILDWWDAPSTPSPDACFTTIASWRQAQKDLEWQGRSLSWSKHLEFLKFIDLPARSGQPFELALSALDDESRQLLRDNNWRIADAAALSRDIDTYRRYIQQSRGEFTVAKAQNIVLRSGWFSDRSASYLAAGRPVITQDTAFGNIIPTGRGLFAFQTMDDVLAALDAIAADYAGQCRAAREIAAEWFAAEKVLAQALGESGLMRGTPCR